MSRRALNLIAVAGAVAAFVWVVSGSLIQGSDAAPATTVVVDPTSVPSSTPSPSSKAELDQKEWRGYALAMPEVDGLPADLHMGDRLEIWVAWDPPVVPKATVERLIDRVIYERTIPPTIPGEAPVAVVLVPEGKVDELMWGDRYGSLSVAMLDA